MIKYLKIHHLKYFFCTQRKFIFQSIKEKKTAKQYTQFYKNHHLTMNVKDHSVFLSRFIQAGYSDGNMTSDIIQSSFSVIYNNLSSVNNTTFLTFINVVSFRIFPFHLISESEKLDVLQESMDRFRGLNLKGKSFCLKYACKLSQASFQDEERVKKLMNKFLSLLKSEQIFQKNFQKNHPRDFVFYLRNYHTFHTALQVENSPDYHKKIVNYIYKKIDLLEMKDLSLFIHTLLLLKQKVENKKIFSRIDSFLQKNENFINLQNYRFILETVQKIDNQRSYQIASTIFQNLKNQTEILSLQKIDLQEQEEKEEEQEEDLPTYGFKKLQLYELNIIFKNMAHFKYLDDELYLALDNTFTLLLPKTFTKDIKYYIAHRKQILQLLAAQLKDNPSKLRLIKKEHIKFTLKVLNYIKNNERFSLSDILEIVEQCQQYALKSRMLKRQIEQIFAGHTKDEEQEMVCKTLVMNY